MPQSSMGMADSLPRLLLSKQGLLGVSKHLPEGPARIWILTEVISLRASKHTSSLEGSAHHVMQQTPTFMERMPQQPACKAGHDPAELVLRPCKRTRSSCGGKGTFQPGKKDSSRGMPCLFFFCAVIPRAAGRAEMLLRYPGCSRG